MSFMLGQHTPTANVHRHNRTFRDQAPGVPGTVLTDDGPRLLSNNLHAHTHTHTHTQFLIRTHSQLAAQKTAPLLS